MCGGRTRAFRHSRDTGRFEDMPEAATPDSAPAEATIETLTAALSESTRSLFASIEGLTNAQAREPSLLPGWSRGHVLTHLARNADALVNLVTWERTGEETPMYASREQRAADIEAGSGRPPAELVEDVHRGHERLMAEIAAAPAETWDAEIAWGANNRRSRGAMIPKLRRIEVEIH